MSHPNTETIEEAYRAFSEGDVQTLMDIWTDDVTWHVAGDHPLAGDHAGKGQVAAFLGGLAEQTGGRFRVEFQHALADDEHGFSLHKSMGPDGDEELESWAVLGYRFADGKIAEIWSFDYDQRILERILG